ncbi:MAG: 3-hydroxyacyl-ACP dehydratase FabZ family protein [Phycisphaerales bacterium]
MSSLARESETASASRPERPTLVDLSKIDLSGTEATREQMFEVIPHRHEMALLDRVVWANEDFTESVASIKIRGDEFWVSGHFPGRPMMPGVLMVEAGAQLACWLYNKRQSRPSIAAFLRIDKAVFRQSVTIDDTLYVLCKESKQSARRFCSDIQGVVNNQIAFEASIIGMRIGDL